MAKFRLWKSRWLGPAIDEWQTLDMVVRRGVACVWRLRPDGTLEYRPMSDAESEGYMSVTAW